MKNKDNQVDHFHDPQEQLNVIFDIIGTPTMAEIENMTTKGYLHTYLSCTEPKQKKNLRHLFPCANDAVLDLLDKMLQFDPKKRISVQEALEHNFLKRFREMDSEGPTEHVTHHPRVVFDFDEATLTRDKIRALFRREAQFYSDSQ